MTRPDWDTYFLAIAETVAQRADCTRSKVGAVLVNARNEIRGTGYNGSPASLPGCLSDGACPRGKLSYREVPADSDYSNCIADHAERNALRHSRPEDLKGATLYVTRPPCPGCTTLIEACGIIRVVSPPAIPVDDEWWDRVNERPECTHQDNQVTLDKADPNRLIAWVCTCGARKECGGKWSTSEECTHRWAARSLQHDGDASYRIRMKCTDCEDVKYMEGG